MPRTKLALTVLPAFALAINACGDDGGGSGSGTGSGTDTGSTSTGSDDGGDGGSGTTGGDDGGTDTGDTGDTGGTDTGTGTGTGTGGGGDLDGLIESVCNWEFNCCSTGEAAYRVGPFTADATECVQRITTELNSNDNATDSNFSNAMLDALAFLVNLDRSEPNSAAIGDCIDQWDALACNSVSDPDARCVASDSDPCDFENLFSGTQAEGDPCSEDVFNGLGDIECQQGTTCEEVSGGTWECVDKGLDGDFCSSDEDCENEFYCDASKGTCTPKGDVGDDCAFEDPDNPDSDTETKPCLDELSCYPTTNKCVAACTEGFDCSNDTQCPDDLSCIPTVIDGDSTSYTYCQSPGAGGSPCDTNPDCDGEQFCASDDTCQAKIANGGDCSDEQNNDPCVDGQYCDNTSDECTALQGPGDPCTVAEECNPSTTIGCYAPSSEAASECLGALRDTGEFCDNIEVCKDGLICDDVPDDGNAYRVCTSGATEGDTCDTTDTDDAEPSCGINLYCDTADTDQCVARVGPGESCDADDGNKSCTNDSCVDIWNGDYCTDAVPIEPHAVGEPAATCDGA